MGNLSIQFGIYVSTNPNTINLNQNNLDINLDINWQ